MSRRARSAAGGVTLDGSLVRLWGEVDTHVVEATGYDVALRVAQLRGTVQVDASAVTFMDSAGLALVVRVAAAADDAVLVGSSGPVDDLLDLTGTRMLFGPHG